MRDPSRRGAAARGLRAGHRRQRRDDRWTSGSGGRRGRRSSARSCGSWSGSSDRTQAPRKHHVDVRIATYNIHRCRGMDRRTMPSRVVEVIRELNADVVALQEVIGAGPNGAGQAEEIGAALGMGWVMTSVRHLRNHLFGNVVLSRFPIVHHSQYDLSWRTCEPRACQRADLDLGPDNALHIYNVHLGTAVLERRYQATRLAAFVHDRRIEGAEDHPRRLQRMDAGAGDQDAQLALREHRHLRAPETPAHLPGHLPDASPRPHLLRGTRRSPRASSSTAPGRR